VLFIFGAVRVEQVCRNTADIHAPGMKRNCSCRYRRGHRVPFAVQHWFDRQVPWVQQGVIFSLPLFGSLPAEIALPIKKTDPDEAMQDHWRFGVVPGQHPQPPAAIGRVSLKTELSGKYATGFRASRSMLMPHVDGSFRYALKA